MDVQWQLPKGFTVGPLRYPVPSRLTVAGLMNYVYERDYAVLVRLNVPAGARGVVPIRADARWLACTDRICVPEQGELSLELPVGSGHAQPRTIRRMAPCASATARDSGALYVRRRARAPGDTIARATSRCGRLTSFRSPRSRSIMRAPSTSAVPAIGWWSRCRPRRRHGTISTACWRSMAARGCNFMPCPAPFHAPARR